MTQFEFSIDKAPDFSFLKVRIPAGETIKVEASAMATMDSNIQMKTQFKGGLGRLLTGESIFINEFTAQNGSGELNIAPSAPGDIAHVNLNNESIYLQNSAFVASDPSIKVESKWQGLTKAFFSGEGLFLIKASGSGDLWFNSYGGILALDVNEEMVVDTGHIVAFTEHLEYQVSRIGGYKSLFFSGEGFVCRFRGQGKVWIQTRKPQSLVSFLNPFRPAKK